MNCHPLMHTLFYLACIIASITCIFIGLAALNIDIYSWPLLNNDQFMMIAKYVIGASGVLSLLKIMMLKSHCACHQGMQK